MIPEVIIYCDGSCLRNPGPGGWAAILMHQGKRASERVVAGYELFTTNNRMELRAAIEGLRALKRKCRVNVYCDSLYVVKGMTEWMNGWKKSDFHSKSNKPIANVDLWQDLVQVANGHSISWHWVRGHAGDYHNQRVDEIAREQAGLAIHFLRTHQS